MLSKHRNSSECIAQLSAFTRSKNNFSSKSALYNLFLVVQDYWWLLAVGILLSVCAALVDGYVASLIKPFVDGNFTLSNSVFTRFLPVTIVMVFVIRGLIGFTSEYCISRTGRSLIMLLRQHLFQHVMHLSFINIKKMNTSKMLSIMIYNIEQVAEAVTDAMLTILQDGLLVLFLLVVMVYNCWQLSLLCFATFPIVTMMLRYSSRRLHRVSCDIQTVITHISQRFKESLDNYLYVHIYGATHYESTRFDACARTNMYQEMKRIVTKSSISVVIQILLSLPLACAFYLVFMSSHPITSGDFALVVITMSRIIQPLKKLSSITAIIQKAVAASQSVAEFLNIAVEDDTGKIESGNIRGDIDIKEVTYRYSESKHPIVDKFTTHIAAGSCVAIVGYSGSGKTTLLQLISRFLLPEGGSISLDGQDINDFKQAFFRKQFSYVGQATTLFNDTIMANIIYGSKYNEERFSQALHESALCECVQAQPDGANTVIGDDGANLSGGERQRIIIARAFYKQAPIMLLDEPTSALDTKTEEYIRSSLYKLIKKHTTIIVAHRLSTIIQADKILLMNKGRLVAEGTHEWLLTHSEYYQSLYETKKMFTHSHDG